MKIKRLIWLVILLCSFSFVSAAFFDSIQFGSTGIGLYDSNKELVDFLFFGLLFAASAMLGVRVAFKNEQRGPGTAIAIMFGLAAALAAVKSGLSPTHLAPFIKYIIFFIASFFIWNVLVHTLETENGWAQFGLFLLAMFIVWLILMLGDVGFDAAGSGFGEPFPGADWVSDFFSVGSFSRSAPSEAGGEDSASSGWWENFKDFFRRDRTKKSSSGGGSGDSGSGFLKGVGDKVKGWFGVDEGKKGSSDAGDDDSEGDDSDESDADSSDEPGFFSGLVDGVKGWFGVDPDKKKPDPSSDDGADEDDGDATGGSDKDDSASAEKGIWDKFTDFFKVDPDKKGGDDTDSEEEDGAGEDDADSGPIGPPVPDGDGSDGDGPVGPPVPEDKSKDPNKGDADKADPASGATTTGDGGDAFDEPDVADEGTTTSETEEASGFPWLWVIGGVLAAGAAGVFFLRHRGDSGVSEEETEDEIATEEEARPEEEVPVFASRETAPPPIEQGFEDLYSDFQDVAGEDVEEFENVDEQIRGFSNG